jgi:hypothetical protein
MSPAAIGRQTAALIGRNLIVRIWKIMGAVQRRRVVFLAGSNWEGARMITVGDSSECATASVQRPRPQIFCSCVNFGLAEQSDTGHHGSS